MTNSKNLKKALFMSVLSIVLCISMLIGSTLAWFTDTATTGVNKIVSGNLDIDLVDVKGETLVGQTLTFKTEDNRKAEDILWEPGCTYALPDIYVVNKGTLDLKYQIIITGIDGDAKLNEAIVWTIQLDGAELAEEYELEAGETSKALTISGHMKEDAGNEYMNLSIDGISITVIATQLDSEFDSFDDQYDKDAQYKYDGPLKDYVEFLPEENPEDEENPKMTTVVIKDATGLMAFAEKFGTEETKDVTTVLIAADINLTGCEWKPINAWDPENSAVLTIDGQDHTISNMTVEGGSKIGFIGSNARDITIKNLTFDNANVTTSGSMAAVVIGYQYGDVVLDNVDVTNSTVKTTAEMGIRLGALVGQSFLHDGATLTIENCDLDKIEVSGYHNVAGMVGSLMNYSTLKEKWEITNSSVKNSTFVITSTASANESYFSAVACEGGNYGDANKYTNDATNFAVVTENNTFDYATKLAEGLYYSKKNAEYTVKSAEGFVSFTNITGGNGFLNMTVKLDADINLGIATIAEDAQTWKTIATFAGTFDGQGHTISNLNANLFGTVSGTVKNLNVENVNILNTAKNGANGFIGTVVEGGLVDKCTVSDVTITWADTVRDVTDCWGGVISRINAGATVQNSEFNNIKVQSYGKMKRTGAIFAEVTGTISGCTIDGVTLIATDNKSGDAYLTQAGGIIADLYDGAEVSDCIINNVTVTTDEGFNVGGIIAKVGVGVNIPVGNTLKNITVSNLTMTVGNTVVTSYATIQNVGGFIGQVDYRNDTAKFTMDNCHINGLDMTVASVKAQEDPSAGFISSLNGNATITNCSVDGKIDGTNEPIGIGGFLGTVGGYSAPATGYVVNISACAADVAITGNDSIFVGGFVGHAGSYNQTMTLTLNFTDCEATGSFYGQLETTDATESITFTGCKVDGADFAG